MTTDTTFAALLAALPSLSGFHAPTSKVYDLLRRNALAEAATRFAPECEGKQDFGPFGEILFPHYSMGNITSLELFGIDELIIFSLYHTNRNRYKNVADIGANIGLHSLVLSKCGYNVRCYEPDPVTFERLMQTVQDNDCKKVEPINAAVSEEDGELEFIRVLGNTTGSHLAGSKENPYGELEKFPVTVKAVAPIMEWADFIKLDAEGHEKQILLATTAEQWKTTDMICEIGTDKNAEVVYAHMQKLGVNMFAQKINWGKVESFEDMPTSYKDGSLFISSGNEVPWEE